MPDFRGAVNIDKNELVSFKVENLPLDTINWDVEIYPEDLANEEWPSSRLETRKVRQNLIDDILSGDLSEFIEVENVINRFAALKHMYKAMILASDPEDYKQISDLIDDLFDYSRGVIAEYNGTLITPDWRNVVPLNYSIEDRQDAKDLDTDGFIYLKGVRSPDSNVINQADLLVFENGQVGGGRYEATAFQNSIRPNLTRQLGEYRTVPATWSFAQYEISGKSIVEDAIDVAVEIAQLDQIMKTVAQEYSLPIFTANSTRADLQNMFNNLGLTYSDEEGTSQDNLNMLAKYARYGKMLLSGDGFSDARYVESNSTLPVAMARLKKMEEWWTLKTGQVMMESGDASELAAGVALARRQAQLTIRIKDMFRVVDRAYRETTGRSLGKFIDNLNPAGGENAGINNQSEGISGEPTE